MSAPPPDTTPPIPSSPGPSSDPPPPPPTSPPVTSPPPTSLPTTSPTTTPTTTSTSTSTSSSTNVPTNTPTNTPTPGPSPTPTPGTQTTPPPGGIGAGTTQTSTKFVSQTGPGSLDPSSSADSSKAGGKSFFENTGAVAGTFAVVGLIALALIIALATNLVRRRKAKKFDRELAEATREAASAPAPIFLDDDDDNLYGHHHGSGAAAYAAGGGAAAGYGAGAYGGSGSQPERQFSDVSSHGTYAQPAMSVGSHHGESYGMREMGHGPGAGVGEIFDPYGGAAGGGAAGAAGIGVARARSMRADGGNAYASGLSEGGAPYAAFASGPGASGSPPMPDPYRGGMSTNHNDLLEAAGMGAHVAGAGAMLNRGPSQYNNGQQQQYGGYGQPTYASATAYSQHPPDLHRRTPSQNASRSPSNEDGYAQMERGGPVPVAPHSAATGGSAATQYYSPTGESYASHYAGGASAAGAYAYQPSAGQQQQPQQQYNNNRYSVAEDNMEDAYGGYEAHVPSAVGHASPASAGGHASGKRQSVLANPFDAPSGSSHGHSQGGHVITDKDSVSDYSQEEPRRVLKVANE